ncbi:RlpA-like double-psi beta-barrel-protein domain-containing protein-containing protein [Mycena vulgaris]|nr:RlpA-like double-psi beta-barrel-protein domain-containing protein-containing protein [Mycena vulgaris]
MFSFLSLLLLPAVSASHITPLHRQPKRGDANTGDKRFSFYDVGLGACGGTNSASEYVVALTTEMWNNGDNCYKEISLTYKGKTANAQIVDECMSCPYGGLDLSTSLFNFFEDPGVGIIHGAPIQFTRNIGHRFAGDWSFVDSQLTTTKTTVAATTTSHTSTTPSTTPSATPSATPPAKTSTTKSSSSSSSSSSSVASTTIATSSSLPTSTASTDPQGGQAA